MKKNESIFARMSRRGQSDVLRSKEGFTPDKVVGEIKELCECDQWNVGEIPIWKFF